MEKKILCDNLCFAYRLMVASVPLLKFAIERSDGMLLAYYKQHLEEEAGHDEMLLDDLRRLGVKDIPHYHVAAQIAGSQYYLIAHDDPALLLGYMHALESNSMAVADVDALSNYHGVALTALRHHALHDPMHRQDLENTISVMEQRDRIQWNEACVTSLLQNFSKGIYG